VNAPVSAPEIHCVTVFADGPGGGNPAPLVLNADAMSGEEMRAVAASYGHEAAFVLPPPPGADLRLRFFVPNHEMEMCGHATVGAVWLLHHLGRLAGDHIRIATLSGMVEARIDQGEVEISQPAGRTAMVPKEDVPAILSVLGVKADALGGPVVNAATSRVKTLVPLKSAAVLNDLVPDFSRMEALCESLGSTGLYPFAPSDEDPHTFEARQFPKSSGYPEDPATGVAAAALAFGLLAAEWIAPQSRIRILQGRAMGRPSAIQVRFARDGAGGVSGCWLGGPVHLAG
jgi:PhzF family phenazine biosynthesis protein